MLTTTPLPITPPPLLYALALISILLGTYLLVWNHRRATASRLHHGDASTRPAASADEGERRRRREKEAKMITNEDELEEWEGNGDRAAERTVVDEGMGHETDGGMWGLGTRWTDAAVRVKRSATRQASAGSRQRSKRLESESGGGRRRMQR